jgi:hypothetical protein
VRQRTYNAKKPSTKMVAPIENNVATLYDTHLPSSKDTTITVIKRTAKVAIGVQAKKRFINIY